MEIACLYSEFPGGRPIESKYDTLTGLVDGLPGDICRIRNDPFVSGSKLEDEGWFPTRFSHDNLYMAASVFPNFCLILADSYNHAYVVFNNSTIMCNIFETGEFESKEVPFNGNAYKDRILFSQNWKSIGLINTVPGSFDYALRPSVFNVFSYNGKLCYLTNNGIKEFNQPCDMKADFRKLSYMQLARSGYDASYLYNGEIKYYNL